MARRAEEIVTTEGEKPRRGRPPRAEGAMRGHITFRVDDQLRDLLAGAATRSKWSISEEVTYRLQRSFDRESVVGEALGSRDVHDIVAAAGMLARHVDRLLATHPVARSKINDVPQYGRDDALQLSAGVIAFLQAINGLTASEIIDLASAEYERKFLAWREAAVAATAQALGTTLADAAKKVDLGGDPPKFGMERLSR